MRYVLGRPQIVFPFDELFNFNTVADCGVITFNFVDADDGSPIDRTLFSAPQTD